ncbi:dihydrofolate reductase family protein [Arthrobacter sp. UYEF20]|uniref:dihydrofolate reductase family protein n=1 Tax=Arthrobacter sp. UYEF20 TaxID=1756363 RepID=UPI0033953251
MYPDEDTEGSFAHGGGHAQYFDDVSMSRVVASVTTADSYLLGRRTYEVFAAHWPHASAEEQTLAQPLNSRPKYVASTTLTEPLGWRNSTLLRGDLGTSVRTLKQTGNGELLVIGSSDLVQSLLEEDLVDEFRLMIDPLLLGSGKRLFPTDGQARPLRLIESQQTSTGAILATYVPAHA